MTSHIPLQLPLASPFRTRLSSCRANLCRHENASLVSSFFKRLPRLGCKHPVLRILQSLQNSPTRCKMLGAALCRPFMQEGLCGSKRSLDYEGFAGFQHDVDGLIETLRHYANSNKARKRGGRGVVA